MNKNILISNVMMDGLAKLNPIIKNLEFNNGYGTWLQYIVQNETYDLDKYSCVIVVLDGESLREIYPDGKNICNVLDVLADFGKNNRSIKIYVSNIKCRNDGLLTRNELEKRSVYESAINQYIYNLSNENSNLIVFPLKEILDDIGESNAYSKQMLYLSSCPFSVNALKKIAEEISRLGYFRSDIRKKCLVLDMDNTLWGGVMGEDGLDGIRLSKFKAGRMYYDFQRIIKKIKETGVILALCSKNNPEDIMPVFEKDDMLLKKEDFVCLKIGWERKSKYVNEIAKELNIGIDSMVFIDDNPVERDEVRSSLSGIVVPSFPENPVDLEKFGKDIYSQYFYTDVIVAEDLNKTEMYKANQARNLLKSEMLDIDSFIRSLKMNVYIEEDSLKDVTRISQMTQKTNQFNVTTKRYTENEIVDMINSADFSVFIGRVVDRFGDNGITILCIVKYNDKDVYIDEFLMSCRIMERKLEYEFLRYIENKLANRGYKRIIGKFIPTKKNMPSAKFFDQYGFESADSKSYVKNITNSPLSGLINIIDE